MVGKVSLHEAGDIFHEAGDSEEISSTTESRIDACEEIISMGSDNARDIYQHTIPPVRHHADEKHCVWQEYHRDVDDPESRLRSSVRLGERVDESHRQG